MLIKQYFKPNLSFLINDDGCGSDFDYIYLGCDHFIDHVLLYFQLSFFLTDYAVIRSVLLRLPHGYFYNRFYHCYDLIFESLEFGFFFG